MGGAGLSHGGGPREPSFLSLFRRYDKKGEDVYGCLGVGQTSFNTNPRQSAHAKRNRGGGGRRRRRKEEKKMNDGVMDKRWAPQVGVVALYTMQEVGCWVGLDKYPGKQMQSMQQKK